MIESEKVVMKEQFDLVLVAGDVNSILACAFVGAKSGLPIVYVGAGIHSFEHSMPELN